MVAVTLIAVKPAATATVAMAAEVGAMVAAGNAAMRLRAKSAHPAKALAEARVDLKAVKAKPGLLVVNAPNAVSEQNAVIVPRVKAAAMADPKRVVTAV